MSGINRIWRYFVDLKFKEEAIFFFLLLFCKCECECKKKRESRIILCSPLDLYRVFPSCYSVHGHNMRVFLTNVLLSKEPS